MHVVPMQDTQEFNSNYYESQEYLEGGRESSCGGGSKDREHEEIAEEDGRLEDLLWPLEMLSAVENYGHLL